MGHPGHDRTMSLQGDKMALYFLKPVVWNDQTYQRPGGAEFTSGYPGEHGFGHEEWNNSTRLDFSENGQRFRVFHTEGFGNQPLSKHNGRIFVFMIASLKGKQYLISIGGQATGLLSNEKERRRLAEKLRWMIYGKMFGRSRRFNEHTRAGAQRQQVGPYTPGSTA
jgi:hypothetical protein